MTRNASVPIPKVPTVVMQSHAPCCVSEFKTLLWKMLDSVVVPEKDEEKVGMIKNDIEMLPSKNCTHVNPDVTVQDKTESKHPRDQDKTESKRPRDQDKSESKHPQDQDKTESKHPRDQNKTKSRHPQDQDKTESKHP
ncbi:hypothetical protein WMY93_009493 [Mugilogobius chulae]|uniref:Uncharacterized protein n=1 Tax=Mugilogobius chulae TaxID=88201 RepID=A0AAW0PBY0_9GOBI